MKKNNAMNHLRVIPLLVGLCFASTFGSASAQSASEPAATPITRAQVKMERDEFLRTHKYDVVTETWTLNPGIEAPAGVKTRAEIKAERDDFLKTHRYDVVNEQWVPVEGTPRELSKLTRAQVREETKQFVRTHRWDEVAGAWVEKTPVVKKKKGG
jgi:hypothetical protein